MDIKNKINYYFYKIKNIFAEVILFLKEILKLPHAKKYIFSTIPLTLIFIIATFPYDVLIQKQLASLEQNHFQRVHARDINFSFFSFISLSDVNIILNNKDELTVKEILLDATLNPYTLIFSKRIKADTYLNDLKYSSVQGRDFRTSLNANIDILVSETGYPESGVIKMIMQNSLIQLDEIALPPQFGGFNIKIDPLRFNVISLDATFQNKNLMIDSFQFAGPDLRGAINGVIYHAAVLQNSRLNLTLKLSADSPVLSPYKDLFSQLVDGDGNLTIPVRGTISRPQVNLF